MVLTHVERPVLGGLKPVPGSVRLIGLRFLLITFSALPALLTALAGLATEPGRQPYFTESAGSLPLIAFGKLLGEVFPAFAIATIAGTALAVLGDQILTAGALVLLGRTRAGDGPLKGFGTVCRAGAAHFWPFARLLFLALALSGSGVVALRALFKALDRAGETAGWTGATRMLTLPFLSACLVLLWLASVGAWLLWCRILTIADDRHRARRTALLALRVLGRHPLRSWAFFVAATLGTAGVSGSVVILWMQAEPKGALALTGWGLAWLLAVLAQAFVWHWLLRSGCLLSASASLVDLRRRPDEPFGVRAWIYRRLRRKPAAARSAPPESEAGAR